MSSSRPDLKATLNKSINDYLTLDNKEKEQTEGVFTAAKVKLASIFSHGGPEGRARAIAYREVIAKNIGSEDELVLKILQDIDSQTQVLGTSRDLRKRLLEGLCAYFQINEETIKSMQAILKSANVASITPYGGKVYSEFELNTQAMRHCLREPTESVKSAVHASRKENRSTVSGYGF